MMAERVISWRIMNVPIYPVREFMATHPTWCSTASRMLVRARYEEIYDLLLKLRAARDG
jgi:hypothetical protein